MPLTAILYSVIVMWIGPMFMSLPTLHSIDMAFVVSLLVVSQLHTTTLMPDFILTLVGALVSISYAQASPLEVYLDSTIGIRLCPPLVLIFFAMGCHSSSCVAYGMTVSVFVMSSPRSTTDLRLGVPLLSFTFSVFVVVFEFCLASLFEDLRDQIAIKEKLLDSATDGVCTLDVISNTVASASPQLLETFGCGSLVGMRLSDFVDTRDAHKLEFDINFDNSSAVDLSPVLVTCHRKAGANGRCMSAFDAQFFPYTLSEGRLHVFVKVSGELRHESAGGELASEYDEFLVGPTISKFTDASSSAHPPDICRDGPADHYQVLQSESQSHFIHGSQHGCSLNELETQSFSSLAFSLTQATDVDPGGDRVMPLPAMNRAPRPSTTAVSTQTDAGPGLPNNAGAILISTKEMTTQTDTKPGLPLLPADTNRKRRRASLKKSSKAFMRNFDGTPTTTIEHMLLEVLHHTNPLGRGCCLWHVNCHIVLEILQRFCDKACTHSFKAFTDWQCKGCLAMNAAEPNADDDEDLPVFVCDVCSKERECDYPDDERASLAGSSGLGDASMSLDSGGDNSDV